MPRVEFKVVLAFGTDVQVSFKILPEDGLAAAGALDPQSLGTHGFSCSIRVILGTGTGLVFAVLSLEPGHTKPHSKWLALGRLARAQVGIIPVNPVLARRIEDIKRHRVNQRNH